MRQVRYGAWPPIPRWRVSATDLVGHLTACIGGLHSTGFPTNWTGSRGYYRFCDQLPNKTESILASLTNRSKVTAFLACLFRKTWPRFQDWLASSTLWGSYPGSPPGLSCASIAVLPRRHVIAGRANILPKMESLTGAWECRTGPRSLEKKKAALPPVPAQPF